MEKAWQRAEWLLLAVGVALAVALGRAVQRLGADSLPQAPSESVLTLVLGDARQQLSLAFYDKVEDYFHGGVRNVACTHVLGEADSDEHEDHEGEAAPHRAAADPWSWLNGQVHVQEHAHMKNEAAVELLPWIWASCRTSPKNIQAFVAGSYVLARMLARPEDGARLLKEGIRANPQCSELEFSLGELYFSRLHDPARAESCFLAALEKNAPAAGKAGEAERALRLRILFYLGYLAQKNGDAARLRACVRQADAVDAEDVVSKDLHALLNALENKKE